MSRRRRRRRRRVRRSRRSRRRRRRRIVALSGDAESQAGKEEGGCCHAIKDKRC